MHKTDTDKIQFSILVPVSSPVKKYLNNNVFLKRPFQVTNIDPVGIVLLSLLKPVPKYYKPRKKDENNPGYIAILVGPHYANRSKLYLDAAGEHTFNTYIEGLLRLELFQYIESLSEYRKKIRTLINDFMDKYDITEDEMTLHAVEKAYYRWKKKLQYLA